MAGITVAEGVVEVTADARDVGRKIATDIEGDPSVTRGAGEGMGRSIFGGIVGAWAAIGATQKIGDFFTGSITGASDLNETLSKSGEIFGSSAKTIEAWGDKAARSVGLSKEAAIAAAATYGDMFTQLGFTESAAADMSQTVVQLAADLGSFNNLETADVADRISAAFRGEYDSLQAVIPNINAARVESEALSSGLVETTVNVEKLKEAQVKADIAQKAYTDAVRKHGEGSNEARLKEVELEKANAALTEAMAGQTGEITAAAKAQAVMNIVQQDGARAMGDFARTSDGAANKQKILTAQVEDQQAKLGGLLLPAWSGFLGLMSDSVVPAFGEVIEWMSENGTTMLWLGGVVAGAAASYWLITTALGVYKAYQIASAAATGGLTVAQWALNAAMSANPIGLIITAIAALVAGIVWVATQTTFFQDVWAGATEVIGTAWEWLWGTVLEPVFSAIGAAFEWLGTNVFGPIGEFIGGVVNGIAAVFTWIYETIIIPVVTGIMLYIGLWAALISWLWETVAMPVFNAIGALFTWLGVNVFGPIGAFIGSVFSAIGAAFQWVYSAIIVPVAGFIGSVISGVGAVFSWLYTNAIKPAFDGVAAAFNWVWGSVISPVISWISSAIDRVGTTVRIVFGGIGAFIGSAFQSALSVIRGPINGIISLVNSAIRGLNSLSVTIPDWVPIVGGQTWGLSIPQIPMLARGSKNAPDTFIAGERGPELITGAGGAKVYPADETRRMLGGGDQHTEINIEINEAEDPLGSAGRVAAELRKWGKR